MTSYDCDMHVFEPEWVLGFQPFNPPTIDLDSHKKWLDQLKIEKGVLFPTTTLLTMDPTIILRYNDWIRELVDRDPSRRFFIAQPVGWTPVSLWGDVLMLKPPIQDWFSAEWLWQQAQELDKPIAFHTSVSLLHTGAGLFWESHVLTHPLSMMTQLVQMIARGIFEKYPKLRCAFLEGDDWWVTGLLYRMWQHTNEPWGSFYTFPKTPSEYVTQNCFFADGSDYHINTIWGSDFPHIDQKHHLPVNFDSINTNTQRWLYGTAHI